MNQKRIALTGTFGGVSVILTVLGFLALSAYQALYSTLYNTGGASQINAYQSQLFTGLLVTVLYFVFAVVSLGVGLLLRRRVK